MTHPTTKEEAMSHFHARLMTMFLAVTFFAGLPAFVQAEPEGDKGMRRGAHSDHDRSAHNFVDMIFHSLFRQAKDLGLSDEQTTKLKALKSDYEKAKIRGEADLKLAEVDVQTLAHDEKADMSAIEGAVRKSETAHANLRIEGIKTVRAAFAVLTPDQRQKMRSGRSTQHDGGKGKGDYDKGADGKSDAPKGGSR
jgi:Spy/CpxP family protein refolding chaperone